MREQKKRQRTKTIQILEKQSKTILYKPNFFYLLQVKNVV